MEGRFGCLGGGCNLREAKPPGGEQVSIKPGTAVHGLLRWLETM